MSEIWTSSSYLPSTVILQGGEISAAHSGRTGGNAHLVGVAGSMVMVNWSDLHERLSSLADGAVLKLETVTDFQVLAPLPSQWRKVNWMLGQRRLSRWKEDAERGTQGEQVAKEEGSEEGAGQCTAPLGSILEELEAKRRTRPRSG